MNFIEMIKLLEKGAKVTHSEHLKHDRQYLVWHGNGMVVRMEEGTDDWFAEWVFDFEDYISESWGLYKETPKLHTFEEAIKAFKNGKTISLFRDGEYYVYNINGSTDRLFDCNDILSDDWLIKEV